MTTLNYKIYFIFIYIMLTGIITSSAQLRDSLRIKDSRYDTSYPGNYNRSLKVNFKRSSVIGLNDVERYSTVIGLRGWISDNSGGKAYELAFASGKIFLRSGYTDGWGNWQRLLTDNIIKETENGNIGISTTSPQSKLAVNGTITATKVKVTQNGWPDFVFDSAFQLLSLDSLSHYIQQQHHLPGVPTAQEVKNNGIDIGKSQAVLLQKIEEAVLHLMRQHTLIQAQHQEIEQLKGRLSQMELLIQKNIQHE